MPDVEAHITGTVWKIEVEVGDTVDEGDTVVILESMKMEMPVEAEDPGVVKEILSRKVSPCPRVTPSLSSSDLAERQARAGPLLFEEPAPGVARLTISTRPSAVPWIIRSSTRSLTSCRSSMRAA